MSLSASDTVVITEQNCSTSTNPGSLETPNRSARALNTKMIVLWGFPLLLPIRVCRQLRHAPGAEVVQTLKEPLAALQLLGSGVQQLHAGVLLPQLLEHLPPALHARFPCSRNSL